MPFENQHRLANCLQWTTPASRRCYHCPFLAYPKESGAVRNICLVSNLPTWNLTHYDTHTNIVHHLPEQKLIVIWLVLLAPPHTYARMYARMHARTHAQTHTHTRQKQNMPIDTSMISKRINVPSSWTLFLSATAQQPKRPSGGHSNWVLVYTIRSTEALCVAPLYQWRYCPPACTRYPFLQLCELRHMWVKWLTQGHTMTDNSHTVVPIHPFTHSPIQVLNPSQRFLTSLIWLPT